MMWEITKPEIENRFNSISFKEENVLNYYDGVLSFKIIDNTGQLVYGHMSGYDEDYERYIIVPKTNEQLLDLLDGDIAIREFLGNGDVWILDISCKKEKKDRCWLVNMSDIPEDHLPYKDVKWQ